MFASISVSSPLLTLQSDDKEAVRFLYPQTMVTVSGVVHLEGGGPAEGATVELIETGFATVQTADDGTYTISAVPNNVHYDIVATLDGDSGSLDQVLVSGVTTVNLVVLSSGGGDSGGFCPPGHARRALC